MSCMSSVLVQAGGPDRGLRQRATVRAGGEKESRTTCIGCRVCEQPKSQSLRSRCKSSRMVAVPLSVCYAPDVSQKAGHGSIFRTCFAAHLALPATSLVPVEDGMGYPGPDHPCR